MAHTRLQHLSAPQSLPLISASRWLLKRGELFVVEEAGLFRKLARPTYYLFLFNDVLVVTKKKRWVPPLGPASGCVALPRGAGSSHRLGAGGDGGSRPEPPLTSELGAHQEPPPSLACPRGPPTQWHTCSFQRVLNATRPPGPGSS